MPDSNQTFRFRSRKSALRFGLRTVLGCAAGLLVTEAALRLIATPSAGLPFPGGIRYRQCMEGCASSTFAPDGARLTGNSSLPGAAVGLIIGDSHVLAEQVPDRDTMGSVLERRLRQAGESINVRQYGASGAAAPTYCLAAPWLLERWRPSWVVVLLNRGDIGLEPFQGDTRFEVGPDNSASLVGPMVIYLGPPSLKIAPTGLIQDALRRHSALATLTFRRWKLLSGSVGHSTDPVPVAAAADRFSELAPVLSVKELKKAYGSRLMIAYDPKSERPDDPGVRAAEEKLLQACHMENTRYVTLDEALAPNRAPRGFNNTRPNSGHYNARGHRLIAEALFKVLR